MHEVPTMYTCTFSNISSGLMPLNFKFKILILSLCLQQQSVAFDFSKIFLSLSLVSVYIEIHMYISNIYIHSFISEISTDISGGAHTHTADISEEW